MNKVTRFISKIAERNFPAGGRGALSWSLDYGSADDINTVRKS